MDVNRGSHGTFFFGHDDARSGTYSWCGSSSGHGHGICGELGGLWCIESDIERIRAVRRDAEAGNEIQLTVAGDEMVKRKRKGRMAEDNEAIHCERVCFNAFVRAAEQLRW